MIYGPMINDQLHVCVLGNKIFKKKNHKHQTYHEWTLTTVLAMSVCAVLMACLINSILSAIADLKSFNLVYDLLHHSIPRTISKV